MLHVAIDLGSQKSQICIRDEKGNITKEQSCPTNGLKKIFERLPKPSRVIVETGSESFTVAEQAQAAGHEVRVVPSTLAPSLGVGEHGVKTDRRDAQKISEASVLIDLPSVHIPRTESRRRKTLTRMRGTLVEVRTKLINSVRGWWASAESYTALFTMLPLPATRVITIKGPQRPTAADQGISTDHGTDAEIIPVAPADAGAPDPSPGDQADGCAVGPGPAGARGPGPLLLLLVLVGLQRRP